MMLPDADLATIHPNKILKDLFDSTNPNSQGKPKFFGILGYQRSTWGRLHDDLLAHGRSHSIVKVQQIEVSGAERFTIEGVLTGPNGKSRWIRTVWDRDPGSDGPRLITAYPLDHPPLRLIKEYAVKEYDAVEVLTDHLEWSPPIPRGTKDVIVDISDGLDVATVEFTLPEEIEVYSFRMNDLRVVEGYRPRDVMSYLTNWDPQ